MEKELFDKHEWNPDGVSSMQDYSNDIADDFDGNLYGGCLRTLIGWAVLFLFMCLLAFFSSCRSTRTVLIEVRDSTSTHVHHEVVYVPDTIPVVLPPQIVEHLTPDTIDTLRTGYAESVAKISDGMLFHSLRSLQNPIPVPVQHKETVRDSIVYREKEVPKEVPVVQEVEKPLTWWQQFRIHVANIVLWVLVIYAAFIAVRFWLLKK